MRSWAVVVELERGPDGRRRQKWHVVHGTKKTAEQKLAELLHSLDLGLYVEPSRLTLNDYLQRWLNAVKGNIAGKTYERYQEIARLHLTPALGNLLLPKLTPLHIQAYYSKALESGRLDGKEGGLSAQTVLHHHRILREALHQAVKWQLLARNPADAVEPPKPERREMKAIDASQMAWLHEVVQGTRFYVPLLLAITTGMRRGEFLGLRWSDVDLRLGMASVRRAVEQTNEGIKFKSPKGKRGRLISLPTLTVDALKEHHEYQDRQRKTLGTAYREDDLVCALEDGSLWAPDTFTAQFARLARRIGLKGTRLHDMRHSHATHLLQQGVHPKIVSERLGHSTVAITLDTYSHVLPGMQEDAALKVDSTLREAIRKQRQKQPT